jgi:hypothetical protein
LPSQNIFIQSPNRKVQLSNEFRTNPQLAAEMLNNLVAEATLPFKFVLADSVYGTSSEFIEAVEALVGVTYFVSVPENTMCWLQSPVTIKKQYKYCGELRTKTVLADAIQKPITVATVAKNINSYFWYLRKVSEGTKGPISYEFTRRRVKLSNYLVTFAQYGKVW